MSRDLFIENPFIAGINEIRSSWGRFLALGIALTVLGFVCIVGNITATFATVFVFGWALLFAGVLALIHAFQVRTWSGFFLYFFTALLRGVTGYLLIRYPAAGAFSLTLLLASFFLVTGIFRAVGSALLKFPRWGWAVFSGIVSVALGFMLFMQMPTASIWFIGLAIGVDLVFDGGCLIAFAAALNSLPKLHMTSKAA